MERRNKHIVEWRGVKKEHHGPQIIVVNGRQTDDRKWVHPMKGCLKLNVDAFVIEGAMSFKFKKVLRDHTGHFVNGKNMRFVRVSLVLKAESLGVHEAMSWIFPLTNKPVSIKSDSLLTVNAICKGVEYRLEVGHIFDSCRAMIRCRRDLSLHFIREASEQDSSLDGACTLFTR